MAECSERPEKVCTKCKEIKSLTEFPRLSRSKDGYHPRCKCCMNSYNKQLILENPEQYRESRKANYQKNIDKMREEKRKSSAKFKDKKIAYDIEYREKNKDKIAAYKKEWEKNKRHEPLFKLTRNLRRRVHHALKGDNKSAKTFELIGCDVETFKAHIESLWLEGMSWDNYGPTGWHIDHIKPCHTFNLTDEEQQRECFHFSNQRPLWAKDNLSRPRMLRNRNIHKSHQSHQGQMIP